MTHGEHTTPSQGLFTQINRSILKMKNFTLIIRHMFKKEQIQEKLPRKGNQQLFWFTDSSAYLFEERIMCQKCTTRALWRNVCAPPIGSYFSPTMG